MHPYLFDWMVNGHHVRPPSFGVFLALAFSSAYFLSLRNSRFTSLSQRQVEVLFLLSLFSSAVFGRLFHVFFEDWSFYRTHPEKILAVWEGGFTFYGSVFGSLTTFWLFSWYRRISFREVLDLAAVSCCLGLAIGRIGCFLAGCCWGKVCSLPWGVIFSHPNSAHLTQGLKVHPTQIYESIGAVLLFVWGQNKLAHRRYQGEIGFSLLAAYGVLRFIIEYFRGDNYRGFVIPQILSYSQLISIGFIIGGLSLISFWSRHTKT